jgi:hypothetical protein
MRIFLGLLTMLFVAGLAFSQVSVASGEAGTLAPGAYSLPVEPRVTTPEQQFATPPLQVGATNATSGLVAGASNSTSETISLGNQTYASSSEAAGQPGFSSTRGAASFDMGAGISQASIGAAQLAAEMRSHKHASRTYTNADLEQLAK